MQRRKDMALLKIGEIKGADKDNFFLASTANFTKVSIPSTAPDFVSPSGSVYHFTVDGVIRVSDHWEDIATCVWTLDGEKTKKRFSRKTGRRETVKSQKKLRAGFCAWADFTRAITQEI
jgi:hypothetical protein